MDFLACVSEGLKRNFIVSGTSALSAEQTNFGTRKCLVEQTDSSLNLSIRIFSFFNRSRRLSKDGIEDCEPTRVTDVDAVKNARRQEPV